MKTPLLKYVLLALVVVIWGAVFYRVYDGVRPANETLTPRVSQKPAVIIEDSLLLNYRNPFASNMEASRKLQSVRPSNRQSQVRPTQTKRPEPLNVNYLGRVVRGKRIYSILELPTEHFLLQKGDTMQGIKIIGIFEDSLQVRSNETNYTIIVSR